MTTLVIDAGSPRFMGIMSAEDQAFTPYYFNSAEAAIQRIFAAGEIITFNGNAYDLTPLSDFPELKELPPTVNHTDMKWICYQASSKFFGKGLIDIYVLVFGALPSCPDEYKEDEYIEKQWQDCYMTFKLWDCWKTTKFNALAV